MFGRKKSSVDITPGSPVFYVRYAGSTETFIASGKGCTRTPVQRVWDNARDESEMRRVSVTISPSGLCVRDLERKEDPGIKFPIEDISYCNADSDINVKIFSWISKSTENNKIKCHVVLCSSLEKARAMALVLSRAFQIAYKEWKADKKRIERKKSSSSTNSTGSSKAVRHGQSKQHSTGLNVRTDPSDNPTSGRENLNITHDEDSFDSGSKGNESLTENNIIIDPDTFEKYRHDEAVKAVMKGDDQVDCHSICTQNQVTSSASSASVENNRQPNGLVMV